MPVITHTVRPSVTGEGDDIRCLRIVTLPPPSGRFHRTAPVLRSTAQNARLLPSPTFRKIGRPR